MGRENTVYLYGRVDDVRIKVDDEYHLISGRMAIRTIRRTYSNKQHMLLGQDRWDRPAVYSRNEHILTEMKEVDRGDMVLIKGTLCTADTARKFFCPECNHEQIEPKAVAIYVDPIFIKVIEHNDDISEEEADELIRKNFEISNQVYLLGTVCREPFDERDYVRDEERNTDRFQFQLASKRIRRIREDEPEKIVDFPWCKCYGEEAVKHHGMLHKGSSVYIDGAIQTRKITLSTICEVCGETLTKTGIATDIVPYHVEYIDKCGEPFEPVDIEDVIEDDGSIPN